MTISLRFCYATQLCALFALTSNSNLLHAFQAQDSAAEIHQLKGEIREQRAAIEGLLQRLKSQESALERMERRVAGVLSPPSEANVAYRSAVDPAQSIQPVVAPPPVPARRPSANWFERINLRGYVQARYNGLGETNPNLSCDQCDRSIGQRNGISLRRARMVFSGEISERVSLYLQPDFASSSSGLHFGQLRDLYFDVHLDKDREFRIRVGQSKVPFGFENLQSSQNRLSLDRNDALNSAVVNERDLGVYLMYAPKHIRQRFKYLVDSGLKGSGDYGVLAMGVYNGQNANRPEANTNLHKLVRLTYPLQFRNGQIVEAGIQGYTGQYTIPERGALTRGPATLPDRRMAVSLVAYPQPFGFQAEYNWGTGPEYTADTQSVDSRRVTGGYVQLMHRQTIYNRAVTTFAKSQYFSGGKKYELDARRYLVRENEMGMEWQFSPVMELTGSYVRSDRTYEDSRLPNNRQIGRLLRLQLQFNY